MYRWKNVDLQLDIVDVSLTMHVQPVIRDGHCPSEHKMALKLVFNHPMKTEKYINFAQANAVYL